MSKRYVPDRNLITFSPAVYDPRKELDDLRQEIESLRPGEPPQSVPQQDIPLEPAIVGSTIYASYDFGESWFQLNSPLDFSGYGNASWSKAATSIAISSSNIVTITGFTSASTIERYASNDGGNSWVSTNDTFEVFTGPSAGMPDRTAVETWWLEDLGLFARYATAGGFDVLRLSADGVTWVDTSPIDSDQTSSYIGSYSKPIVAGTDILVFFNDAVGLRASVSSDMGATWTEYSYDDFVGLPWALYGGSRRAIGWKVFGWNGELFANVYSIIVGGGMPLWDMHRSSDLINWSRMTINGSYAYLLDVFLDGLRFAETGAGLTLSVRTGSTTYNGDTYSTIEQMLFDGAGNDWFLSENENLVGPQTGRGIALYADLNNIMFSDFTLRQINPGQNDLYYVNANGNDLIVLDSFPWRLCSPQDIAQAADGTIMVVGAQYATPLV